jgi:hypothetical protein
MSNCTRTRRILSTLTILLSLSLPAAASAVPVRGGTGTEGLLAALWHHLTAPIVALWAPDEDPAPVPPPPPASPLDPETDGRTVIDPFG